MQVIIIIKLVFCVLREPIIFIFYCSLFLICFDCLQTGFCEKKMINFSWLMEEAAVNTHICHLSNKKKWNSGWSDGRVSCDVNNIVPVCVLVFKGY